LKIKLRVSLRVEKRDTVKKRLYSPSNRKLMLLGLICPAKTIPYLLSSISPLPILLLLHHGLSIMKLLHQNNWAKGLVTMD
jgi:hypothetical protein